jgi:hypothetical protein
MIETGLVSSQAERMQRPEYSQQQFGASGANCPVVIVGNTVVPSPSAKNNYCYFRTYKSINLAALRRREQFASSSDSLIKTTYRAVLAMLLCLGGLHHACQAYSPLPFELPQDGKPTCFSVVVQKSLTSIPGVIDEAAQSRALMIERELKARIDKILELMSPLADENTKCLAKTNPLGINHIVLELLIDVDSTGVFADRSNVGHFAIIGNRIFLTILNCSPACATIYSPQGIVLPAESSTNSDTTDKNETTSAQLKSLFDFLAGVFRSMRPGTAQGDSK